jgi:hypothetical protein
VDVASWLRDLGLERYEAAFRENEVTIVNLRAALGHGRVRTPKGTSGPVVGQKPWGGAARYNP